jgi:hypothetical protein
MMFGSGRASWGGLFEKLRHTQCWGSGCGCCRGLRLLIRGKEHPWKHGGGEDNAGRLCPLPPLLLVVLVLRACVWCVCCARECATRTNEPQKMAGNKNRQTGAGSVAGSRAGASKKKNPRNRREKEKEREIVFVLSILLSPLPSPCLLCFSLQALCVPLFSLSLSLPRMSPPTKAHNSPVWFLFLTI